MKAFRSNIYTQLLSEEGYYPFGMTMSAISSIAGTVTKNNYKFNAGTELTESFDINYYETYFRQYDAQLGRFTGVDPLAEQTLAWSPYQFGYNNPAMFNDPTGLLADAAGTQLPEVTVYSGINSSFGQFQWMLVLDLLANNQLQINGGGGDKNKSPDKLRGGSQKDRDRSIKRYPKPFQNVS